MRILAKNLYKTAWFNKSVIATNRQRLVVQRKSEKTGPFQQKKKKGEKLIPVRILCTRCSISKLSQPRKINKNIPRIDRKILLNRVRLPHVYHVIGHPDTGEEANYLNRHLLPCIF